MKLKKSKSLTGYWASRTACAFVVVALLSLPLARGSDFVWTEEDWSGGQYDAAIGTDPEVHPGILILENRLDDFRYLGQPANWQGLWSMEVYHDTLFITASDYPYDYDGAQVIAYDYVTDNYSVPYEPYESGLHLIKAIGDTLYVPGPDSMDPWTEEGSIYTYDGIEWVEKASLPTAIHVNDVTILGDTLFATTGHATGDLNGKGCVWMSTDWGDTFTRVFTIEPNIHDPWRRLFAATTFNGTVFVQPDGSEPEERMIFTTTNGTEWDTLYLPTLPPPEKQAVFTEWGDSLLMAIHYKLYIWNGSSWISRTMPFGLWRYGRGIHIYKGDLYGGGQDCELYRWDHDSVWDYVGGIDADPTTENIAALATYYGRIFLSTSRVDTSYTAKMFVSAAAPSGVLRSLPHDFGVPTANGILSWDAFSPDEENRVRFQLRSSTTLSGLESETFIGPDGTDATYYEESPTPLPFDHHGARYFQYRAVLSCPDGVRMPFLRSLTLEADSLSGQAVDEPPEPPAPALAEGIFFHAPYPNPARTGIRLQATLPEAALTGRNGDAASTDLQIRITDLLGRIVREERLALSRSPDVLWEWDLRDRLGRRVPAGVYRASATLPGSNPRAATRSFVILP